MTARDRIGVVHGMPIADYHAHSAIGSSSLKKLARSPAHFYGLCVDPNRPAAEPTASMIAGTLAHCVLLEPEELDRRYIVRPPGMDGRTKEGKAWAVSVPPGMTIVSEGQLGTALRQAAAVRALPEVAQLLRTGEPELSAFWHDEDAGVDCKCRPDWCTPVGEGVILLDLKTCQSAAPDEFSKTVHRFGYAGQCAWYVDGYQKATGRKVLGMVFAAVEADFPYAAAAFMLAEEWVSKARVRNAELLRLYTECKASGAWPAFGLEIQVLEPPPWI